MKESISRRRANNQDPDYLLAIADLMKRDGHVIESTVKGYSMGSTLPDGVQIRIQSCGGLAPIGKIVAFLDGTTVVAHRVVAHGQKQGSGYLLTLGDDLWLCDPPVSTNSLIGYVSACLIDGHWQSPGSCPTRDVVPQCLTIFSVACSRAVMNWNVSLAIKLARFGKRSSVLPRRIFRKLFR